MTPVPREGMMAQVRNRLATIIGVTPYDAHEAGRYHLVDVEYADGLGAESEQLLWEVEPDKRVMEPLALPKVGESPPMPPQEFDAMVRAARWSALTPSLPFSGLADERPPLAAPLFGAIYPEAYQLVPVLRALDMPRVALLLADAVGLGKTIQAGMVLRELMLRRRIRRILVICPASLRTQWRDEMQEKFALPFTIVDRPETLQLQRELGVDANPWRNSERIVASYHYLKQPDVLEQFRNAAEPRGDGRLQWDLLVVDEAHNLAPASFGSDSDLALLLQRISPWFEHRIFLTATPHNGHTRSFSGLLEALDPVRFTRKSVLDDEDRRRVGETVIRRLKSEINDSYTSMNQAPRFSERHVLALAPLRFGAPERALQLAVRDFRKALRAAVKGGSGQDRASAAFAAEVLQKRLLSGPWPFGQSWLSLLEGAEGAASPHPASGSLNRLRTSTNGDDTDSDGEKESRQRHASKVVGEWLRPWADKVKGEMAEITRLLDLMGVRRVPPGLEPAPHEAAVAERAVLVQADARFGALCALIDERLRDQGKWRADERLIVFTEYLATLEYLRARLRAKYGEAPWLLTLFGGLDDRSRDSVKQAFNDVNHSVRLLLATDAAGEGLNLQRAARLLLHWDIPWNPGKMEQRNGRLDRHGQERDVFVYHFDSADDASMQFLGKVLRKRSQTREDRVVTDEIFADAILLHFDQDEDIVQAEARLDRAVNGAKLAHADQADDLPAGMVLPGADDESRLNALRAEIDLSPQTLRETLETALAVESSRPRLQEDGLGRDRLVHPVPPRWRDLVAATLKHASSGGELALVFDPSHYVQIRSKRPVFLPEPDSRLLHLGDALYHRVMSTFAGYRFGGGSAAATRWTVRTGGVPDGLRAVVRLTVEEMAVNDLREPCHHWVRTLVFGVYGDELGDVLPHEPAAALAVGTTLGQADSARDVWSDVELDLKKRLRTLETELTASVSARLQQAAKLVLVAEKKRFEKRKKELDRAVSDNQIEKLEKEVEKELDRARQQSFLPELDQAQRKRISDLGAEIALRRGHYEQVVARLADEEKRTINVVLPARYALRGTARIYPVAVEIRLAVA